MKIAKHAGAALDGTNQMIDRSDQHSNFPEGEQMFEIAIPKKWLFLHTWNLWVQGALWIFLPFHMLCNETCIVKYLCGKKLVPIGLRPAPG
jgi:hypothetical protein